jgi:hypothetical protein
VVELADQFHWTFERMKVAIRVIANMHYASTDGAVAIEDVEFPGSVILIRRPALRHPLKPPCRNEIRRSGKQTRGCAMRPGLSNPD